MTNALPPHGSPADRGSADRYYGRPARPHFNLKLPSGTYIRIGAEGMTKKMIKEYYDAWDAEEDRKDWGYGTR